MGIHYPNYVEAVPVREDEPYTPMQLELTEKAKAMIPNRCPYCDCGLLGIGQSGKDFGECPAESYKVVHISQGVWVIESEVADGYDDQCEPKTVCGSVKITNCPKCGRILK